jgi:hypothetical protein
MRLCGRKQMGHYAAAPQARDDTVIDEQEYASTRRSLSASVEGLT